MTPASATSAEIRARLGHPVVDADGHLIELAPVFTGYFLDFAKEIAGGDVAAELARRDGLFYEERRPPKRAGEQGKGEQRVQDDLLHRPQHAAAPLRRIPRARRSSSW